MGHSTIGLRIGQKAKERGLSPTDLAHLMRSPPSQVERLCAGDPVQISVLLKALPHVGLRLSLEVYDSTARASRAGDGR